MMFVLDFVTEWLIQMLLSRRIFSLEEMSFGELLNMDGKYQTVVIPRFLGSDK